MLKILSASIPIVSVGIFIGNQQWLSKKFSVCAAEHEKKLEQVQIIFRHGARTPLVSYQVVSTIDHLPWDKDILFKCPSCTDIEYKILSFDGGDPPPPDQHYLKKGILPGGSLPGQLTYIGQQDTFNLGRWLAKEYIDKHGLISPQYSKNQVYTRSSNMNRTILSAKCLLAGIFGKDNIKEPITIFTKPHEIECIYPNWDTCNYLKQWSRKVWTSLNTIPGQKEDRLSMQNLLGMKEGDEPLNFIYLLDLIHTRRAHGMTIPEIVLQEEEIITKRASQLMGYVLAGEDRTNNLRCSCGAFLETLCVRMREAIDGNSEVKLLLYSSHDTTVIALLMVFGVWKDTWPPYNSNIILELYKGKDSKRFVRVVYNKKPLLLDGENEYIPVEQFLRMIEKYRTKDWAHSCGNHEE